MTIESVDEFRSRAIVWLESSGLRRRSAGRWGSGSDDVSVFHNLADEDERELLKRLQRWQQTRCDAGFGAIAWAVEDGGLGLSADHDIAFTSVEADFETPPAHELLSVTLRLIAPAIKKHGTPWQRDRFIKSFFSGTELCCQLFSEPSAGSDLAALETRARRVDDGWLISGQKVWSSGAQFSDWGELIARTDPDVPKHRGMTAFMVPMDAPGVDIRPLRQASGGTSFNEVFLTDVLVPDSYRLGEVGQGWTVALDTLSFEREASSHQGGIGGDWRRAAELVEWLGQTDVPKVRELVADMIISHRLGEVANARDARRRPDSVMGSLRKMQWVERMSDIARVVTAALGPRIAVDSGEWGTFAWGQHVLGVEGYRIAGGSDEIQRTIIAERFLGLPAEPRVDKGVAWRDVRR